MSQFVSFEVDTPLGLKKVNVDSFLFSLFSLHLGSELIATKQVEYFVSSYSSYNDLSLSVNRRVLTALVSPGLMVYVDSLDLISIRSDS
tara:strand:+ start:517 stop:783 length:267 start_codon:yes stop_codon:yes gene_type:complete